MVVVCWKRVNEMFIYLQIIDSIEDQTKFENLYYEYKNIMYQVALKILHNKYDAEDAVHQAFLKIAEKIDIIDNKLCARTKSFVIVITERKALDILHYNKQHPILSLDEEPGISIEYSGANDLTLCMTKLPATYRQVLLLKHYHGYSSKETAKILGLSESNVIKIDQRAKKKLRELYQYEDKYTTK